jgi:hypothetical protein
VHVAAPRCTQYLLTPWLRTGRRTLQLCCTQYQHTPWPVVADRQTHVNRISRCRCESLAGSTTAQAAVQAAIRAAMLCVRGSPRRMWPPHAASPGPDGGNRTRAALFPGLLPASPNPDGQRPKGLRPGPAQPVQPAPPPKKKPAAAASAASFMRRMRQHAHNIKHARPCTRTCAPVARRDVCAVATSCPHVHLLARTLWFIALPANCLFAFCR